MRNHAVHLLGRTADALSEVGMGEFSVWISLERAAWLVLVLRRLEDDPRWFPGGKWATIQSIEEQLENEANGQAAELEGPR